MPFALLVHRAIVPSEKSKGGSLVQDCLAKENAKILAVGISWANQGGAAFAILVALALNCEEGAIGDTDIQATASPRLRNIPAGHVA